MKSTVNLRTVSGIKRKRNIFSDEENNKENVPNYDGMVTRDVQINKQYEETDKNTDNETKRKLLLKMDENEIQKQKEAKILAEKLAELGSELDDNFEIFEENYLITPIREEKANNETFELKESDVPEINKGDTFPFFWWDAYEDARKRPGVVLLFGKTYSEEEKEFKSCCVAVKNILRKIYLLPRTYFLDENDIETKNPITLLDVYNEFNDFISNNYRLTISSFKSRKVVKHYAFDVNVPTESEYLEVRYEGTIDLSVKTFKTFSHVFGMNSSFLEIFLLERNIKGPCWLNILEGVTCKDDASWTHTSIEMHCPNPNHVSLSCKQQSPPPLRVLALNIKFGSTKNGNNETAVISGMVNQHYQLDEAAPAQPYQEQFCFVSKCSDTTNDFPNNFAASASQHTATKIQCLDSEQALLNEFLIRFTKIDPDVIVGHDLKGYQLALLAERLFATKANNFSTLSRIKRTNDDDNKLIRTVDMFSGRLVCDIKVSAMESNIKCRSYDLDALCENVLKLSEDACCIEIEPAAMIANMDEAFAELFRIISVTRMETIYILEIMYKLNILPIALQITNIAGCLMSRTLMGGRAERNDFLLLHAFNEKDHIVPEKAIRNVQIGKSAAYLGGLVLEPKVGFYDKHILLMDFNSLYPSIIQEYNICFTTIPDFQNPDLKEPAANSPLGILPIEIRKLVESRREVLKLMQNPHLTPELQMHYHIRQMALKLTANSMYGCLGCTYSRFYAKHLAALITRKGREILTTTTETVVEKLSYDVIYGDTDSIMINTNLSDYEQVVEIGRNIKVEINKMYKHIQLDIDSIFKYLLLLKKKKYAAVQLTKRLNGEFNETYEYKGIDIIRRDWSQLAACAGEVILKHLLNNNTIEERIENVSRKLGNIKTHMETKEIPLQHFLITKQLTKDPIMYQSAVNSTMSHVQVARRHNAIAGTKKFKQGDTVSYLICCDGTTNPPAQRAYLLDELKKSSHLSVDKSYYLEHQIYPVVVRLCEPIKEIGGDRIANLLGLTIRTRNARKLYDNNNAVQHIEVDKVKQSREIATPFKFECKSCKFINTFHKYTKHVCSLTKCGNEQCSMQPMQYLALIMKRLGLYIRNLKEKYYFSSNYESEDESRGSIKGVRVNLFTEKQLYTELLHLQDIFTISSADSGSIDKRVERAYADLKMLVDVHMSHCANASLDLKRIFDLFQKNRKRQPDPKEFLCECDD